MIATIFLKGLIVGFSIAAPVGPIGLLCIRRTLTKGLLTGLSSGLGATVADGIFGLFVALGVTALSDFLVNYAIPLRISGGLFLICLGIAALRSQPPQVSLEVENKGLIGAFLSTFFLALTNPLTILSFAAVMTEAGPSIFSASRDLVPAFMFVLGVITGSALWWFSLCSCAEYLRTRLNSKILGYINKFAGVLILIFALYILMLAAVALIR